MSEASGSQEAPGTIEIRLSRPQQLFNSLDPSPFHDRDLDEDAEEYIVESADDLPIKTLLTLIIHLPADQVLGTEGPDLAQAIHNYFAHRLDATGRRRRLYFRDCRFSVLVGLAFLFACIGLRQLVVAMSQDLVSQIADEGLYIVGWVAMWRPLRHPRLPQALPRGGDPEHGPHAPSREPMNPVRSSCEPGPQ